MTNPALRRPMMVAGFYCCLSSCSLSTGEESEGEVASELQLAAWGATASSIQSGKYAAAKAIDGRTTTRWSSQFSDPQWLTVDLGAVKAIGRVVINWHTAYAKDYELRVSSDNSNWTTVRSVVGGDGGTDDLSGLTASGRYVQMYGTRRATINGYSIWEIQVHAPDGGGGTGGAGGSGGSSGSGGSGATGATTGIWQPRPGTSWQWQLTGAIDTSVNVAMYDIDLFDVPQSTIDQLHSSGRVVVCYFSAGSWEDWRPDANQFPSSALGRSNGWPGEKWLDIRDATVRSLMLGRMDLARSKHCDGVEPDNVDGYSNNSGFPLTSADQLDFNRFLAAGAHTRNLSVGLKNDVEQISALVSSFDWALNEECFRYNECDTLTPFISANKAVFQVEYGSSSLASTVCPQANALNFDSLIKNLDLDAWRIACR